ncbi:uncharacterized protein LOC130963614 [Arachis stenosperma]|uniref:uncharacterized protein LOC130963614 n=1 Tax=Arachis stenosperma TaxID=217475 RepID=UPI0025AC7B37|nr:uncharacterized protein LOC130963614 [Arachis stenosperma]
MELVDLPLNDRMFTWFRGRSCSSIDRALVSLEWLEQFPETRIQGGPRGLSDHCPIILEENKQRRGPRPFRSLDSWFTHEGFLRMVKEEWRGLGQLQFTDKLKALTVPLGRWHKANFSDMDKKIMTFEEEIKKIDDMVSSGVYDGTMEARRKALVTCCERWYVRKEIHWKQMSRSRQAKEMDKNTRYFHNIASARRRNNKIDTLLINGRLEESPMIRFRDDLVRKIGQDDAGKLEMMPSADEIREAVWDCESSKAPGCDGYNMNFIKRCWNEIGLEFTTVATGFFQTSRLPAESNITWVALAQKFVGAREIKDLRLISMVGCVYKVISKILVRRMRQVMPELIGETQSAFVKGRKIHDGAIIAYETVDWLKRRKKEAVIIKLDFQKAYDRVKWSFVDLVLQKMGFGLRWRSWVMECLTTASMSILINGSPSKPFKMERGLRQGGPLSPFLFVLVVDVLHRMIGEAVRNGRISPLLVERDSVELSHLQFADDTILFSPPEEETIRNYKRLLRCFELMSRLSINFDKSSLIPVNCEEQWVHRMCRLLGCKGGSLPIKYLGIPLEANPRLVRTWKPIIDKVVEKLSLWKAKRKDDGSNGMALVKWEVVQAPKKLGGLGVGDAMIRNTAMLFKWWWRFAKEDCPLWKRMVCSCNNLSPNELLSTQELPTRGGPWKDICQLQITNQHVREKLVAGLSMEVGDGQRTHFWEDVWLLCGLLKDRFPRLFFVSNQCGSVIGDCCNTLPY